MFWKMDKNIHSVWPDFFSCLGDGPHLFPWINWAISPPFLLLSGRESQHRGHRAAAEHSPGEGAGRARAGEAAQPRGLFRRHQEEAGGSRGEQGTSSSRLPRCPASGCAGEETSGPPSLCSCSSKPLSHPPIPLKPERFGTIFPKGEKDLSQQLWVERCFGETFPSYLFSSDPFARVGGFTFM